MIALVSTALAHGVGVDQVVLQARGDTLLVVATPRTSFFPFADDDGDGFLTADEVRRHKHELNEAFDRDFVLDVGQDGTAYLSDIIVPDAHSGHGHAAEHVRFLRRLRYPQPVSGLKLVDRLIAKEAHAIRVSTDLQGQRDDRVLHDLDVLVVELGELPNTPARAGWGAGLPALVGTALFGMFALLGGYVRRRRVD